MISILERKPTFTKLNGDIILDLTVNSINYNYEPRVIDAFRLDDSMTMRPDLMSIEAYSEPDFWDLILKFNSVSNPFSILNGDLMLIPDLSDMRDQLAPVGKDLNTIDAVRKQYIDVSKKAQSDPSLALSEAKRRETQRALGNGFNQSKSNLPPNFAEAGDKEIVIKGGKIYFGPNITKNKEECQAPVSKSEFINKLITKRLNG